MESQKERRKIMDIKDIYKYIMDIFGKFHF